MQNQDMFEHFSQGKGFIAALDQSGGSTPTVLRNFGIEDSRYSGEEEMMATMHAMRERIVTSASFSGNKILGAILFEHTMDSQFENMMSADYLWQKRRVLSFLKIDIGLAEEDDGFILMKPITGMDETLKRAQERNIFGTKMRSVINKANPEGVESVVKQQFEFANRILDCGLVPIVEPEVSINSAQKMECENLLFEALVRYLDKMDTGCRVALKLTLPEKDNLYRDLVSHPNVIRVSALSGGYEQQEACRRLAANNGMIASFSRALVEGLNDSMSDTEFDHRFGEIIEQIYQASIT